MPKRFIIGVSRVPDPVPAVKAKRARGLIDHAIALSNGTIYPLRVAVDKSGKLRPRYPKVPFVVDSRPALDFELGWRGYFDGLMALESHPGISLQEFMAGFTAAHRARLDQARKIREARARQNMTGAHRKMTLLHMYGRPRPLVEVDFGDFEQRVLARMPTTTRPKGKR